MKFHKTSLADAMLIDIEPRGDARGSFARVFCAQEFAAHGLQTRYVQANHSSNVHKGTLRGMHFQKSPHGEVKLVRAVRGGVHDVIIDLRRDSPTYGKWEGFDLTADNGRILYVPVGFAHGFQTLHDACEVTYMVSHAYTPAAESGVRFDDPAFGIDWPMPVSVIAEKDAAWPHVNLDAGIDI